MRAVVYSDNAIRKPVAFSLTAYDVRLSPIERTAKNVFSHLEKFMPAYTCEIISKTECGHVLGSVHDLHRALDCILPLLGFDYTLSLDFEMWQDYDGSWLPVLAGCGSGTHMWSHSDLPNPRIHEIVEAYEALSLRKDKRSRKIAKLRARLGEAVSLSNISPKYGFLAYYNVVETVADDLIRPKEGEKPLKQKVKVETLLTLFPHTFNVADCIKVADIRNALAHSDGENFHVEAALCKQLALWASECLALQLASEVKREPLSLAAAV